MVSDAIAMEAAANMSAFAAYSANTVESTDSAAKDSAAADDSFRNLSRSEMIARLISKKKNEIKRKRSSSEAPSEVPKKNKRKKNGAAKSAPESQNNSLSPKETNAPATNGSDVQEKKAKVRLGIWW